MAIKEVSNVPESNGKIPKCFSVNKGVHWVSVIKSMIDTSLKNCTASMDRTKTIPIVTAMVISELANRDFSMINSLVFRIRNSIKIRKSGIMLYLIFQIETSVYLLLSTKVLKFSFCFVYSSVGSGM